MNSKSEQAITQTFKLAKHLSVTMTAGPGGFTCEWSPREPASMSRKTWRKYEQARETMACKLATLLGGVVAMVVRTEDGKPAYMLAAPSQEVGDGLH